MARWERITGRLAPAALNEDAGPSPRRTPSTGSRARRSTCSSTPKPRQPRSPSRGRPRNLGLKPECRWCDNDAWVGLSRCFSNPSKPLRSLISRVLKGSSQGGPRTRSARKADQRGPVRENSRQSQTCLSASNRAELVAAHRSGVPVSELTLPFGVHRSTVRQLARRTGLETRSLKMAAGVRSETARLYESGHTLVQIAERLGISDEAVRAAVVAAGGTVRQ